MQLIQPNLAAESTSTSTYIYIHIHSYPLHPL